MPVAEIHLGEVRIRGSADQRQKNDLKVKLESRGFELLEDGRSALVGKIKSLIVETIHHRPEPFTGKISDLLAKTLPYDYSYLSRLFSAVEGRTIERFITLQKIEKVKELLYYNEMTLSEIAYRMNYSSTAHLSAQFRKETGMTSSEFRKLRKPGHRPLDSLS